MILPGFVAFYAIFVVIIAGGIVGILLYKLVLLPLTVSNRTLTWIIDHTDNGVAGILGFLCALAGIGIHTYIKLPSNLFP